MSKNDTVIAYECARKEPTLFAVVLAVIALPIQIVLSKILIQRFRLRLPRHKILLSLTVSDSIQVIFVAFLQLLGLILQLEASSTGCQVIRKLVELVVISTIVWASGSIVALSIERYVACVHCFRFHEIITDKFVNRYLCCLWAIGLLAGFVDEQRYEPNSTLVALPLTKTFGIIYSVTVLSSSAILAFVQIRLYLISKKKNKTHPGVIFGRAAEVNDLRKRQLKISIVASAVVVLYVVCMCPLAFYSILYGFDHYTDVGSAFRLASLLVASANTFMDPFVYGLGMGDTRQAMKKELKKIQNFFSELLSSY